jgi:ribosomal protein L37AE/L43A
MTRRTKSPRTKDEEVKRANAPGVYVCPVCGERLSGPARDYLGCPVFGRTLSLRKGA